MKRVCLCGPINGCNDSECVTWREWFKQRLELEDIVCVDPMSRDYRGREHDDYREIVELDKRDVRKCSCMVVLYSKPSVGTSMEVFFAWSLGVPVVLIDESSRPLSPWLRYHSTAIVNSKDQAIKKVLQWL